MGQDRPDINLAAVVMDDGDESVIVLLDIENGKLVYGIRMGKSARVSWMSFQSAFLPLDTIA